MNRTRYTKAQLEEIVFTQLENLNAFNDLIRIVKIQNELIEKCNRVLTKEIADVKEELKYYKIPKRKRTVRKNDQ